MLFSVTAVTLLVILLGIVPKNITTTARNGFIAYLFIPFVLKGSISLRFMSPLVSMDLLHILLPYKLFLLLLLLP